MRSIKEAKIALRKDHKNEVSRLRRILRESGTYSYPMRRRHNALKKNGGWYNEEN